MGHILPDWEEHGTPLPAAGTASSWGPSPPQQEPRIPSLVWQRGEQPRPSTLQSLGTPEPPLLAAPAALPQPQLLSSPPQPPLLHWLEHQAMINLLSAGEGTWEQCSRLLSSHYSPGTEYRCREHYQPHRVKENPNTHNDHLHASWCTRLQRAPALQRQPLQRSTS